MLKFPVKHCALRVLGLFIFVLLAASGLRAQSTTVVISQLYGAGGNSGATYNADYVELFNLGSTDISLDGWALQYGSGSATGTTISVVIPLPSGITLKPGEYYLVAGPAGSAGSALPVTADDTESTIAFGAGAGKLFLTNSTTKLTSSCPGAGGSVIDFIGYGTTVTCSEGSLTGATAAAPAPSTTLADIRNNSCTDTDNNAADFKTAAPAPHNSATTFTPCSGGGTTSTPPTVATPSANPSTVTAGNTTVLSTSVNAGTNSVSTVTVDLSSIGGSATQALTASGNTYSYTYTVPANTAANTYTLKFTATDSKGLTGTANASLTVQAAVVPANPTLTNATLTPSSLTPGNQTVLSVKFTAGTLPASTGVAVTADLSALGGSATQALNDSGTNGDATAGDGIYSVSINVPSTQAVKSYTLNLKATDAQSRTATATATLAVQAVPVADFNFSLGNLGLIASDHAKVQTTTVSVQMVNGFSQTVSFACSNLPPGVRCSFSPTSLSTSGISTLTIGIDGASLQQTSPFGRGSEMFFAFALLALPFAFKRNLRQRLGRTGTLLGAVLLGVLMAGAAGCGSANSTPSGSSSVTVSATAGSVTKSQTLNLTVN